MSAEMLRLMEAWDGLGVVSRYDRPTGAWIFIALHDDTLGSPVGGTRMKVYERPEDGLTDALRLAEGMSYKWAAIELDSGGGKAVLALSRELDRAERNGLLERYAALLESLQGVFATGEDLGTTPEDMLVLARATRYVHGYDAERGAVRDPGPFTAAGVFAGMRAALSHVFGDETFEGRSILVQGVGDVGLPLAGLCGEAGATLLVSDLDGERARRAAADLGAQLVDPADVYSSTCDVYAPCAVGATLNDETIPQLACRIVAGSANNQLGSRGHAGKLHERGILYAPDYVINAGGALGFGLIGRGHTDEDELRDRIDGLGPVLREIFREAGERGESPLDAAERRVQRVLARGRS
jgi:leucine dehydrogenase